MAEMRGFVFSVMFIVIFSTLLATIPSGLQGTGGAGDPIDPLDPSAITGFESYENYSRAAFTNYIYSYSLNSRDWVCFAYGDASLQLGAKIYWAGWIWLGAYDMVEFGDRGESLTWAEIEEDAEDGKATYPITYTTTGDSAGTFIAYWNETLYADPEDAWDNDVLYLIHGVGFGEGATNNIGALIVGLLFFSLPEVPILVNLFLATPVWATIIFVIWFLIKEMIPFV